MRKNQAHLNLHNGRNYTMMSSSSLMLQTGTIGSPECDTVPAFSRQAAMGRFLPVATVSFWPEPDGQEGSTLAVISDSSGQFTI